jgi:hypothetical protein
MAKPWELQPGEPDLWYQRFHDHYLLAGPDRTVDEAYRRHRDRKAQAASSDGAPPRHRGRAPGAWVKIAGRWDWAGRARAFDNDMRRRVRDEHFRLMKDAQRKHRLLLDIAFAKFIKGFQGCTPDEMTFGQGLSWLNQLINLDRLTLGMPLTIEQVQARLGRIDDEPTEAEEARMAAGVDVYVPMSVSDMADVMEILIQRGVIDPRDGPARRSDASPDADGRPAG